MSSTVIPFPTTQQHHEALTMLEIALLEYVEKYGWTEKARSALRTSSLFKGSQP
ncbi:MAG: hypothetical protein ACK4Y4_12810 [Brevundimonas sp.]